MKKLLTSLATISLLASPIASTTALTNMHQEHNVTSNQKATNESPETIANKLRQKTIKLDPTVWLGRHIINYMSELNAVIVKDGILTQDEAQYVTWNDVNINMAGWFYNVGFTVKIGSATVNDTVTLDNDSGETPAQIVAKLEKYPIQLNYNYWNGKKLSDYLLELRSILVQEGILTPVEASVVAGLADYYEGYYSIVKSSWIGQAIPINWIVNDRQNSDTTQTTTVQTNNDGLSAQQLASKIVSNDNYHISKNDVGLYSDEGTPEHDIKVQLAKYSFTYTQVNYVQVPHVILKPVNNYFAFDVKKDGQVYGCVPCIVTCDQ